MKGILIVAITSMVFFTGFAHANFLGIGSKAKKTYCSTHQSECARAAAFCQKKAAEHKYICRQTPEEYCSTHKDC